MEDEVTVRGLRSKKREELLAELTGEPVRKHLTSLAQLVPINPADGIAALCALAWYALNYYPLTYLEYGIRSGYAAAAVAAACPGLEIYGIDSWQATDGRPVAPPDHATGFLKNVGYRGYTRLVTGDMSTAFRRLRDSSIGPLRLDLVMFRGELFGPEAFNQIKEVVPHISPGGALVVSWASADQFAAFWDQLKARFPQFSFFQISTNTGLLLEVGLRPEHPGLAELKSEGQFLEPAAKLQTMLVRKPEARGQSSLAMEDRNRFESIPGFTVETMISGNHSESLLHLIGLIVEGGHRPVKMLEIGVAEGQNSCSILANTTSNVTVYGVDPYKAYEGDAFFAKFSPSMFEDFYTQARSKFEQFPGRAVLIRKTSEEAAQGFEDGFFDLIFIDANHTYESVRKDIALWRNKVRSGGILSGDDFDEHRFGGVIRAVNEAFPGSFCLAPGSVWFRLMEDVEQSKALRHKLNQEKAQGMYESGTRVFRSGGYATALELFDAVAGISPDLSDLQYMRALCLIKLGQRERAIQALQIELSKRPDHAEAQELLWQLVPGESRIESRRPSEREPILSASWDDQRLRILLVYNRVAHHMAEFVNIALRKRFPQVQVFGCGPNNEFHIPDEPDSHQRIAALVGQLQIDVLWELESGFVSDEFQFRRTPGPIPAFKMWWVNDSHQFLDLMVQKAPYFDQMFVSMKDDLAAFGPRALWLPGSASVDVAIDYHLPRTHDLTFVGTLDAVHRNRGEMIKRLLQVFPQMNIKQNLFLEGMARELSASKIVFNMSLNGDLNYRVFETLACGAMLMTDRIENGLLDLFEEGKHLIVYDSFDDLKAKIRYYLEYSEERTAIARAGQQKVLQEHTVDQRIRKVLGMLPRLLKEQGRPVPSSLINGACHEINK